MRMAGSPLLWPHAVILADEAAGFFMRAIIPIHLPPYRLSGAAEDPGVSWRVACCFPSSESERVEPSTLIKRTDE